MDFAETEIIRFFDCLNKNKVQYILVGGMAVNAHGFNRSTGDVDIWLADNENNRLHFVTALKEYGIEGAELFHRLPFIAGYTEIVLDNGYVVDIMSDLQFFKQPTFEDCYNNSIEFELTETVFVKIIHISTLISEKEQSKRPKDTLDAEELKRLNNL